MLSTSSNHRKSWIRVSWKLNFLHRSEKSRSDLSLINKFKQIRESLTQMNDSWFCLSQHTRKSFIHQAPVCQLGLIRLIGNQSWFERRRDLWRKSFLPLCRHLRLLDVIKSGLDGPLFLYFHRHCAICLCCWIFNSLMIRWRIKSTNIQKVLQYLYLFTPPQNH